MELDDPVRVDDRQRTAARRAEAVRIPADWLGSLDSTRTLLELASSGAPVELRGERPDAPILDSDLVDDICGVDPSLPRSQRSVHVRRAALEAHRRAHNSRFPQISVLLSTNRPGELATAISQIASQRGVDLQLVLGLHGEHWPDHTEDEVRAAWPHAVEIVRASSEASLGGVLQTLSVHADGKVVSKWDDDDHYGPDHLADLARAWTYSGAEVVGKFAEFVYLAHRDVTIRRASTGAETYGGPLAGGTLLLSPDWLAEIGGWAPVPRSVDQRLLDATFAASGTTYRTHGYQYVLTRRQADPDHTWWAPDEYFTSDAEAVYEGLAGAAADLSSA